jgi:hypothetical protein
VVGCIRSGFGGLSGNFISGSGNFGPPQEVRRNNVISIKIHFFITIFISHQSSSEDPADSLRLMTEDFVN